MVAGRIAVGTSARITRRFAVRVVGRIAVGSACRTTGRVAVRVVGRIAVVRKDLRIEVVVDALHGFETAELVVVTRNLGCRNTKKIKCCLSPKATRTIK
jgi:hypothetical protein